MRWGVNASRSLTELVDDIDRYDDLLRASKARISTAVLASGTTLTDIVGLGPITAAMIIGYTGNIDRFPTKERYASYNATAPVEASSGNRTRHQLNQRGNRQLNWAIHVVASPSSATTPRAACSTTTRSPRARPPKKPSEP